MDSARQAPPTRRFATIAAIASCWALLLGVALLMIGNGLQGGSLDAGRIGGCTAGKAVAPRARRC
jgi:hypothetical protein